MWVRIRDSDACPVCGGRVLEIRYRNMYASGQGKFVHKMDEDDEPLEFCEHEKEEEWEVWFREWLNDTRAWVLAASNMGMNVDEKAFLDEATAHLWLGVFEGMAIDVSEGKMTQGQAERKAERIIHAEYDAWRKQLSDLGDLLGLPKCWRGTDKVLLKWGMLPDYWPIDY